MIKLIVSDMDGTLLDENHTINEETMAAIAAARQAGIDFVIATGRSETEANKPIREAGLETKLICANGAAAYDEARNLLFTIDIAPAEIADVERVLHEEGLGYIVYGSENTYTSDKEKMMAAIEYYLVHHAGELTPEQIREEAERFYEEANYTTLQSATELLEKGEKVLKYFVLSNDLVALGKAKERLKAHPELDVSSSGVNNIEITSTHATKGKAVQWYAEQRGFRLDEVMALGDSYNDVSMLKVVGRSVAMANANEDIQQLCTHTTVRNDESGVAKAIHQLLKEQYIQA